MTFVFISNLFLNSQGAPGGLRRPTKQPTYLPSSSPSLQPTVHPTLNPTYLPTQQPSLPPTLNPTYLPTQQPNPAPSLPPTQDPTYIPTLKPIPSPTHLPSNRPTSYHPTFTSTNEPTDQPSSQPSLSPTRVELDTLEMKDYIIIILVVAYPLIFGSFIIYSNQKYSLFEKLWNITDFAMNLGDSVTDILFTLQLNFIANQAKQKLSHGDNSAASEVHDVNIFFIVSIVIMVLVAVVNFISLLMLGSFQIYQIDGKQKKDLFIKNYFDYIIEPLKKAIMWWFTKETPCYVLPFGPLIITIKTLLYIFSYLFFLIGIIFIIIYVTIIQNILSPMILLLTAISHSELTYLLYGKEENKFIMTVVGLLVEDILEFILQVTYAVISYTKYHRPVTNIQNLSFAFTIYRVMFTVYLKIREEMRRKEIYDRI